MLLGQVTGTVTATAKDASLVGGALLLVQVETVEIVALDTVGAGVGDQVIVTTGSGARTPSQATGTPVDASIIAIVDRVSKS